MKLSFAPLDAKSTPLVGVDYEMPRHPHNMRVILRCESELLERLSQLQAELRAKYEPLLDPDKENEEVAADEMGKVYDEVTERGTLRRRYDDLYYT